MLLTPLSSASTAGQGLLFNHISVDRSTRLYCKPRLSATGRFDLRTSSAFVVARHTKRPILSALSETAADNMPAEADLSFAAALPKEEIGALSFLTVINATALCAKQLRSADCHTVCVACRKSPKVMVEE